MRSSCFLAGAFFYRTIFTLSMAHGCPVPKHHLIHLEQNRKTNQTNKQKKKHFEIHGNCSCAQEMHE